jgi:hypothetical protein
LNIRFFKLLAGALLGVMGGVASADVTRVEVTYINGFSWEDPITDSDGIPLTAGGPDNDDGAIFQVGYFREVSHLLDPASFSENDWTQFTPLTGQGSPNVERYPTTIGGMDSRAEGPFGFLFYPSAVAIELDTEIDDGIPVETSARLGVRFFNGTTLENSTEFNIVTSNDPLWLLPEPEPSPSTSAVLDLDVHALVWAAGVERAFQTALSLTPEPGTATLCLVAGVLLLRRRRSSS